MTRQNTLVSRVIQHSGYNYRKDLTEVFDSVSGNIKIAVPEHLLNGRDLADDPAAVMEALLLESKSDDTSSSRLNASYNSSRRTYSLVDMFDQDDCFDDESSKRQAYGTAAASKWLDKTVKNKKNNFSTKPMHQPAILSESTSTSFAKNVDSPNLVVEMLRNASKLINPLHTTQNQVQQNLLTQTMTAASQVSALPLFLNICKSAKQLQQANLSVRPLLKMALPPNATSFNPPKLLNNTTQKVSFRQNAISSSSEEMMRKRSEEDNALLTSPLQVEQPDDLTSQMLCADHNNPINLFTYRSANSESKQRWEEKSCGTTAENLKDPVSPIASVAGSLVQSSEEMGSPVSGPEAESPIECEKGFILSNVNKKDLLPLHVRSETIVSPALGNEISDAPLRGVRNFSTLATCPATIE